MKVTPYRYPRPKVPARLHIPQFESIPAYYILAFDRVNNLAPGVAFIVGGTTYRGL